MYGFDISEKSKKQIIEGVIDNIRGHRQGEFYDSDEDPFEGVDSFFEEFLGDIRYLVNEEMLEKYVDEDGNIL